MSKLIEPNIIFNQYLFTSIQSWLINIYGERRWIVFTTICNPQCVVHCLQWRIVRHLQHVINENMPRHVLTVQLTLRLWEQATFSWVGLKLFAFDLARKETEPSWFPVHRRLVFIWKFAKRLIWNWKLAIWNWRLSFLPSQLKHKQL